MGEAAFSVTAAQLTGWLAAFLWPFIRILALASTAPVLSDPAVPRQVRIIVAALLALVIAPAMGQVASVPLISMAGLWVVAQQILVGTAMGFSMRLVFTAVQAAGEYIGLQMGLSFAAFFDPANGGSTVVMSRFLNMLALLLFLSFDAHLVMIQALAASFEAIPVSTAPLAAGGWGTLAAAGSDIFASGLLLALPLVAALLILNLAMGILNRAAPQFSIFAVGFPLTLLAGTLLTYLLVMHLGEFLEPRFAQSMELVARVLAALRGS